MVSGSIVDSAIYKTQMIHVYDPSGNFIDVVRDAPLLSGFKEAINAAISPMSVVLPRKFDDFDLGGAGGPGTIAQGNVWKYYLFGPGLPVTGKLRYQGVVDAFAPAIDSAGNETVTVTLVPQSSVIADHGVTGTKSFTATDPVTMFNWFFTNNDSITGVPYANPLTLDGTNPASSGFTYSYPFINVPLSSIFATIVQMLPDNWFFRCNPDLSTTLNVTPITAQNVFSIGQHVAVPQYKQDWTNLKNVIYVVGGKPEGFGVESVIVTFAGGGVFEANFKNSHTGTWWLKLDPDFAIAATCPSAISIGTNTLTPSSMTNIVAGVRILVSRGSGAAETQTVTSTTSSTFTATFIHGHTGAYTIQLDPGFTVLTTSTTQIGPGLSTITPANMTYIIPGVKLIAGGGSNLNVVTSTKTGSDLATFGERLLFAQDTHVTDQSTLDRLAQNYLDQLDAVVIRTTLRVVDYRGDTQYGLGYDIETIQVGNTCKLVDPLAPAASSSSLWDSAVWDSSTWDFSPGAAINQVAVISALTYGFDYVDLEITTLSPNRDAIINKLRSTFQDFALVV